MATLLLLGFSDGQIAETLRLDPDTVGDTVADVLEKLGNPPRKKYGSDASVWGKDHL